MLYPYSLAYQRKKWINTTPTDAIFLVTNVDVATKKTTKSVRPEVREILILWRSLSPIQNVPLVRPHDAHHFSLRTDGQRPIVPFWDTRTLLRTILTQFVTEGVVCAVGPIQSSHLTPNVNYHLLGRLVW